MSDLDQTVYPGKSKSGLSDARQQPVQPSELRKKQSLNMFGYVLLLWAALLISCGSFPFLTGGQADESIVKSSAESETSLEPTTALPPAPENADETSGTETGGSAGDSISVDTMVKEEPEIGEITFALAATDDYEPIGPSFLFTKGITEIHAIFEYRGMSTDYTWERVWYLNDREVARNSTPWTGPESGVFDYFIDNGGNPLPIGDWILELYVEGELQSLGVFIIEESSDADSSGGESVYLLAYTKCDGDHHNVYVADTNGRNEQ